MYCLMFHLPPPHVPLCSIPPPATEGYALQRGLYWWEGVVMARKVAVILMLVFISDPFQQAFWAFWILFMALLAQVKVRPFATR